MYTVSITPVQWAEIARGLSLLAGSIRGELLVDVKRKMARSTRDRIRAFLNYRGGDDSRLFRQTGGYLRSWKIAERPDGDQVLWTNFPGAWIHEHGGTIRAKPTNRFGGYLIFRVPPAGQGRGAPATEWRRARSVRIPARPHVRRVLRDDRQILQKEYNQFVREALFTRVKAIVAGALGQPFGRGR